MIKRRLNLSQVMPGMKLAEPITNSSGITLMPAGIRLTPMFIVRLKKWNIETVEVFLDRPKDKPPIAGAPRAPKPTTTTSALVSGQNDFAREVVEDVNVWFANVRDNPLMMQLRTVVIKRLVAHGRTGIINMMRRPLDASARTEGLE